MIIYSDGKWRFINFDYDLTMGHMFGNIKDKGYEYDMFTHVEDSKKRAPTNLFIALLKNEEFKNKFIKYYEDFVNNITPKDLLDSVIKHFDEEISILIGYSVCRWKGYLGGPKREIIIESIIKYKDNSLQEIKEFLEKRPKYTIEHMKNYFNIK